MAKSRTALALVCMTSVLLGPACVPAAEPEDVALTVILVRHAEKSVEQDDPPLTLAGIERAEALAHVLGDARIAAVYSSQFRRNVETARPLATRREQTPVVVPLESGRLDTSLQRLARRLIERHAGETVVVVGHSNTVPLLMEILGAEGVPALSDGDYDDLFVVTRRGGESTRWLHLHYGEPTL